MKKTIVLATLMLTLLMVTTLTPLVKATTTPYIWDCVRFIEGHLIKYPHPDRDYYEVSPYSGWSREGLKLYHNQIDHATAITLIGSLVAMSAVFGAVLGAKIGGVYGGVIGLSAGAVLGIVLTWVAEVYFLDELDCIWWWTSTDFVDWLTANQVWLGLLCISNPTEAQNQIMTAFLTDGYLRAGSVTFYDGIGIGNPEPTENLDIWGLLSYSNGYIHYLTADVYIDGQLVGYTNQAFLVTMDTSLEVFVNDFWEEGNTGYRYEFAFWEDTSTENPRTITVEEYTIIKAYFNKRKCYHDVAVTSVSASPTSVRVGETVTIHVDVKNGDYPETFDTSLYYTLTIDPLIGTQTVTLTSGANTTLTFEWTPNMTGRYEILAEASMVEGEVDTADNTRTTFVYVENPSSGSVNAHIVAFIFALFAPAVVIIVPKSRKYKKRPLVDIPADVLKHNLPNNRMFVRHEWIGRKRI